MCYTDTMKINVEDIKELVESVEGSSGYQIVEDVGSWLKELATDDDPQTAPRV